MKKNIFGQLSEIYQPLSAKKTEKKRNG